MSQQPNVPSQMQPVHDYGDGVKTPAEIHAETLADPGIPAIQAEVMEEVGPRPVETVQVELGSGVTIPVPMQARWRKSATDFLRNGDFDSWAESVLPSASLDAWDEWMAADPENGEIGEFFERLGKATGLAAGGNRASRRASDRMPKR